MTGNPDGTRGDRRQPPGELRVAVATSGSGLIDQHFGRAEAFAIYRVGAQAMHPLGVRDVARYCQGGRGDEDRRLILLRTLADCTAVFVARIGEGPRAWLTAAGIEPVEDPGERPIEAALGDWYRAYQRRCATRSI